LILYSLVIILLIISSCNLFFDFWKFIDESLLMIVGNLNIKYFIYGFITDSYWNESVWIISFNLSFFFLLALNIVFVLFRFFIILSTYLDLFILLCNDKILSLFNLLFYFDFIRMPWFDFKVKFLKKKILLIFIDFRTSTKTISFDNRIGVHFNVLIRLVNIVFCWT
jgi:hypothetical protein